MSTSEQKPPAREKFKPRENSIAALFASEPAARQAAAALGPLGIDPKTVEFVTWRASERRMVLSTAAGPEAELESAGEEIAQAASESFSDDEKIGAQIDRALHAGSSLLSFLVKDDLELREMLAEQLKSKGALAVYYWSPWTTGWL